MIADPLTFAILFHDRGCQLAPCQPGSKHFVSGYGPHKRKIETDHELLEWIERGNNYALLTGAGELVVIDFDNPKTFDQWHDEAGDLAETFTVKTNRGFHVYYLSSDLRSWRGDGFEVMGKGKAIMGPGCKHPSGAIYQPLTPPKIRTIETLDFPLLSEKPPKLPEPPRVKPEHLGGGVVKKIKNHYLILDLIQNSELAGRVRLKSSDHKKGRWFAGRCPFHGDKQPSFWIDTERNLFGCRSCGKRGDVLNFFSIWQGLTIQETIKTLAGGLS